MKHTKSPLKSKTIRTSIAIGAAGVLQLAAWLLQAMELPSFMDLIATIPAEVHGVAYFLIAVVMAALRHVTTQPLSTNKQAAKK